MSDALTVTINPSIDVSTSVARVAPIRKLRCARERREPGGGGVNVARVVQRFGGDVLAAYSSGGVIGQLLERLMAKEGLRSLAIPIAGETREDFTVLDEETKQEYRFVLPGPEVSEPECAAFLNALAAVQEQPRFLVASGSLPPGAPHDLYARIAASAKAKGARFVIDASGPTLKAALDEGVYLMKPNLRELQGLMNATLDSQDARVAACRRLVSAQQAEIVALSLGGEGALLVTRDRAWAAAAAPVTPVSAVGAGDSFLGALVWALAAGRGLEEAFRYGVAAGSAALLTPGTELCRPADVERLLPQVEARAL